MSNFLAKLRCYSVISVSPTWSSVVSKTPTQSKHGSIISMRGLMLRCECKADLALSDFQNRRATATLTSSSQGNPFRTLPKGLSVYRLVLLTAALSNSYGFRTTASRHPKHPTRNPHSHIRNKHGSRLNRKLPR